MSALSLTMKPGELLALAQRPDPGSRGQLLESILELCAQGDTPAPDLLGQLLADLAKQAERDIRRRLARQLADAEWAPGALVNILALDEIEIARPVINSSPVLGDDDLIGILKQAAEEHQLAVAQRPNLGEGVARAIIEAAEPSVMTALANNPTAQISEAGMARLVDASQKIVGLRAPLASHPRLSSALGERLYSWVGEKLKAGIANRFNLDPALLDAALDQAVNEAQTAAGDGAPSSQIELEDEGSLRTLVDKLAAAGQLRQSYLFKALREGRLQLFYFALARLADLDPADIRKAAATNDPECVALACAATGMDQAVFLRLLEALRDLNQGLPGGGADSARRALGAFTHFQADAARSAFRQVCAV